MPRQLCAKHVVTHPIFMLFSFLKMLVRVDTLALVLVTCSLNTPHVNMVERQQKDCMVEVSCNPTYGS